MRHASRPPPTRTEPEPHHTDRARGRGGIAPWGPTGVCHGVPGCGDSGVARRARRGGRAAGRRDGVSRLKNCITGSPPRRSSSTKGEGAARQKRDVPQGAKRGGSGGAGPPPTPWHGCDGRASRGRNDGNRRCAAPPPAPTARTHKRRRVGKAASNRGSDQRGVGGRSGGSSAGPGTRVSVVLGTCSAQRRQRGSTHVLARSVGVQQSTICVRN